MDLCEETVRKRFSIKKP